jgi:hypothetical protein
VLNTKASPQQAFNKSSKLNFAQQAAFCSSHFCIISMYDLFKQTFGDINMAINTSINAFSIQQFCDAHSISRAKFYLLLKEGIAPRLMKVGRRRLISIEAAELWRRQMEEESISYKHAISEDN